MGPCPFRHGYDPRSIPPSIGTRRFNGAMPFQAWIPTRKSQLRPVICGLQWGHALSGMDMMIGWNPYPDVDMLQWGHALSGMDTPGLSVPSSRLDTLQWGHALSGMDISHGPLVLPPRIRASMGPCPFRHGYHAHSHFCSSTHYRFNGAMPFQAWIFSPVG